MCRIKDEGAIRPSSGTDSGGKTFSRRIEKFGTSDGAEFSSGVGAGLKAAGHDIVLQKSYPLGTEDLKKAKALALQLQCGTAWINKHSPVQPNVPFGGVKSSGFGVEFGEEGLFENTDIQIIWS